MLFDKVMFFNPIFLRETQVGFEKHIIEWATIGDRIGT